MRIFTSSSVLSLALALQSSACGDSDGDAGGGGATGGQGQGGGETGGGGASGCQLGEDTEPTSTTSDNGCVLLDRDTSACTASREAAGLSGYWLEFSCRVQLSASTTEVNAVADGQPDYASNYFAADDPCYEEYPTGSPNPNLIEVQTIALAFPLAPDMTSTAMMGGEVGLAVNGVPIFANTAAPGDDIFAEAETFDRCDGHPEMQGAYHYHSEPEAISADDARFIGVMRDGYPIYGRRDEDGSLPTLDTFGGHTATTAHSTTPTYHYHVNEQISENPGTIGQSQWFLTTGTYRGTPGQ